MLCKDDCFKTSNENTVDEYFSTGQIFPFFLFNYCSCIFFARVEKKKDIKHTFVSEPCYFLLSSTKDGK